MTEQERRRYPRLGANALVRPVGVLHKIARRITDLSGGLRVFSDEEHRVGERLQFELLLPGEQSVKFIGQVVWIERLSPDAPARFDNGITFLDVSEEDLQRIPKIPETTDE